MLRWAWLAPVVALLACSPPPEAPVIRLVDVFNEATVEGISEVAADLPRTEWRFDGTDHSWQAGPGVEGLTVRDGRLVGRSTSDLPIVHLERTSWTDDPDTLHSVHVRLRASSGANLSLTFLGSDDVGVIEAGQDLRLTLEPSHALGIIGEALRKHFDRDLAAKRGVLGSVHLSHASGTEGGDHFVVAQSGTCFELHGWRDLIRTV